MLVSLCGSLYCVLALLTRWEGIKRERGKKKESKKQHIS
jgi:hypothetical protein